MENIRKTEKAIEELNVKLACHENLDDKLKVVESKLDNFNRMEREYFEKDEVFETLNTKVKEMEMKLNEKDQQIDNLLGRLQKVEDKFTDLERDLKNCEKNQFSENGATTMKSCEKCE